MTPRPIDAGSERPWGFLVALLVVAAIASAVVLGPGLLAPGPSASSLQGVPSGMPLVSGGSGIETPPPLAASAGPVLVTAGQGTFRAVYADGSISVSRVDAGEPTLLGRAAVPVTIEPAFDRPTFRGSHAWTLGCPDIGQGRVRIFFGSIVPATGAQYLGPAASGSVGSDGLFLFVLAAGDLGPSTTMELASLGGSVSGDAALFDVVMHGGETQANGCQLIG